MQTILVIICLSAAVVFLGLKLSKQFKKKKDDDCGCGKCG